MAFSPRAALLGLLSVATLALSACGTTRDADNMTDKSGAARMDTILERAARDAKASGNKVETLSLMEKIYDRNPKDPVVATNFAQELREDEQLNRARQVLLPFTEGKDAYTDAVIELAMTQLSLGQYEEAEATARRAVSKDPNSGRAYLALGTALDAQNEHEAAETALRSGIDKWKGDPAPIMNNLALNLAAQNKLDQAYDMLVKAKKISPNRVEIERNLRIIGTLREGADDFTNKQQAGKALSDAKAQTPDLAPEKKGKEPAKPAPKQAATKKPVAKKPSDPDAAFVPPPPPGLKDARKMEE